ncbi:Chromatin assembly factor 1 subunit FSM [Platanthera zijinensis]|uniref:Chromatin assembly factor 1 subunit FSM n=1 Tax=Platanthera zijinensis TaxID=2320716 RepID=A0AAP0C2R6_9ASPA
MSEQSMEGVVEGRRMLPFCSNTMNLNTSPVGICKALDLDGNVTPNQTSQKKRKRACIDRNFNGDDKQSLIKECQNELDGLFEFYKEVSSYKLHLEGEFPSMNSAVACMLEESRLSFSALVDEIYNKMKAKDGSPGVTLASVRSAVLFVGQRMMYGIVNEDVDVLEDESEKCLWCWETRDMKLLPKVQRGLFSIHRTCRKKIHERISVLSAAISVLSKPAHENQHDDLMKSYQKLQKGLNLSKITLLVEKLKEKSSVEMAEKESKLKEKVLIKELEKNRQNAEMAKKRIDQEKLKEKQNTENELKRIHGEIALEEKRLEKEKAEQIKQLKKQEMQAKKDQQRQEKESAELKKQLKLQKQATLMERFLKRTKVNDTFESMPSREPLVSVATCKSESIVSTTLSLMDHALLLHESHALEDLRRMHIARWHKASHSNRSRRWWVRSKPKVNLVQDLKLLGSSPEIGPLDKFTLLEKDLVDKKLQSAREQLLDTQLGECVEIFADCNEYPNNNEIHLVSCLVKKLLQFDKSNRPAYYGTWRRKSGAVGPRNPYKKDPELDYEVDSDEEWEEEEPGEILSDCEDKEDVLLDEEDQKEASDDESGDGFVVPDGYLSENEGVLVDKKTDAMEEESRSITCSQIETENEEFKTFFQQQKYLNNLTEQALRKCHPLIITNFFHEKTASLTTDILDGTARLEQICLQVLCIRACPGVPAFDIIPTDQLPSKDQENHLSQTNNISTSPAAAAVIPDSELPEFVRIIQSSPQNINKVVESIQLKFSSISKSQIKIKVREISEFSDHRWQVKKEVLDRLGLSPSTNKCRKEKGIAKFFTKRCLPLQFLESPSPPNQPIKKQDNHVDVDHHATAE